MRRAWLRRARLEDAVSFLQVKSQLPMPEIADDGVREAVLDGFLLGTSEAQYRTFIERDLVWVLETRDAESCVQIEGFAILMRWETLQASEIWEKRHAAKLELPDAFHRLEAGVRPAYYEQLAVLPLARTFGAYLALRALENALETHDVVLTTTVREPLFNPAAHAFMRGVGFTSIGQIEEHYEGMGRLLSEIHLLERDVFLERRCSKLFTVGLERARREGFEFERDFV